MNARTSQPAIDDAIHKIQRAENALRDMHRAVRKHSEVVGAAGFGLVAIGNLLGADASEHYVDRDTAYGLANAVVALGSLMQEAGSQLWAISEEDEQ